MSSTTYTKLYRLIVICAVFVATTFVGAQRSEAQEHVKKQVPTVCEMIILRFDEVIMQASDDRTLPIFVIAHRGKSESRRTAERRLDGYRNLSAQRDPEGKLLFVFAEGDKVAGLGTIETYVKGRLTATIFFERNDVNPCVGL
ncbi:MAG: hypothetical protein R2682_00250 [Pyrinomonadaceae bacterium]